MASVNSEYLKDHKLYRVRNKRIIALFPLVAVIVAISVFWCLKLVGITITSDALCELEEHTHISSCYSGEELVCFKPEHTHTAECFPDRTADTETANDWVKTLSKVTLTNNTAENLISVANSQVGYSESDRNYQYNALAEKNSYTRYGEWYGSPYGEWNTMFVSFCIGHANINGAESLSSASAESLRLAWKNRLAYASAESYDGQRGDVVFFDTDADGRADRTGIVAYKSDTLFGYIEGDVDGKVASIVTKKAENILGYGKTSTLSAAENITVSVEDDETAMIKPVLEGKLVRYIPNAVTRTTYNLRRSAVQSIYDSEPLMMMAESDNNIIYTSDLTGELSNAVFKDTAGNPIENGGTVYIGQTYIVSLEFSEINTGNQWIQFEHNANDVLTYQIPSNLQCEPFDSWHKISAKTENGMITDVGEYYIDENGLLQVKFYDDANGDNFVDKYSNVDFVIDFSATVAETQSGNKTEVDFNDDIHINLNVDGNAGVSVEKTHGEYNDEDATVDFTIKVEATHGLVKDLVIQDDIWENHHALRDTIVVTDLDGNPLVPQPTISDHPDRWAPGGFTLSDFPDFSAGEGFLIKYKSQFNDEVLTQDSSGMWNQANAFGNNANGGPIEDKHDDDWISVEFNKIVKDGKMAVLEDANGNKIPVIEWGVGIRKTAADLQGTVIIDTLGEGLQYYQGTPIKVVRYDEWGNKIYPDSTIAWSDVTITTTDGKTSMQFPLPSGYAFDLVYYTTFPPLAEGETATHTNHVEAVINTKPEGTYGSADVIGFVPELKKSASGDDGEYVNFTLEADVSKAIKDWGYFYLTDLAAFWGYKNNEAGYLYVENFPEDLVITATTKSGQVITFTPYVEGQPVENTYMLVTPGIGDLHHTFNILFNTADQTYESSKWMLDEDATLKITYKLPFDAKTGTNWTGELNGDKTLEDVLLEGYSLSNEAYLNFTQAITAVSSVNYKYSPMITKKAHVNEDGTIDYTVVFNNTVPGSGGNTGYLNSGTWNIVFNDTFDDKLEYVKDSLTLTAYDPWNDNRWYAKYKYYGEADGNTLEIPADELLYYDFNDDVSWTDIKKTKNFAEYCKMVTAGGKHIYTYTLKLKDEYINTTDYSKLQLDNVAELTWNADKTSGPADETVEYETGLLDKHVVQDKSTLDFGVHINRGALDILEGSDTLTIEDTMTENLSVYWESIKLQYYDKQSHTWVDFDSAQSQYTYTITYDPANNKLTFVVPDELHITIDYKTLITESGYVSVQNSIVVDGKAEVTDMVDAVFKVDEHSGGASGSNHEITLLKQDGLTNARLPNATFALYGQMSDQNLTLPNGVPRTIVTEDGIKLTYIGSYTTGADGSVNVESQYLTPGGPYAFVELVAPEGYELLDKPVYFYFYDTDPDGFVQSVTTLIAIENITGGFLIPETGGTIFYTAIIGFAATAAPVLYSFIRRKREGRLKNLLG